MNADHDLVQYHSEAVNEMLGEVHDPAEESELIFKIRTLPRKEAREMTREFHVPRKEVMAYRRIK